MFVAETANSYSFPFSKLTTTLRSDVSVISFILLQFSDVPSSRTGQFQVIEINTGRRIRIS